MYIIIFIYDTINYSCEVRIKYISTYGKETQNKHQVHVNIIFQYNSMYILHDKLNVVDAILKREYHRNYWV